MKNRSAKAVSFSFIASWLLLMLGGCAATSPSAMFYELRAIAPALPADTNEPLSGRVIGVGPVELAEVLNRPQLVTAGTGNQLVIAEYHRWGGDLQDSLGRVLSDNLSMRTGSNQVFPLPWSAGLDVDYRVTLNIHRMDGVPGGEARLFADWVVLDRNMKALTPIFKVRLTEASGAGGYPGFVSALDRLLATLADSMVVQLRALETAATARDTP